jgi:hypothetical protein
MTYRLKLLTHRHPILLRPTACIGLKNYWPPAVWIDGEEHAIISPDCINFIRLENEINKLINELEIIKRQGKKYFEKELKK